MKNTENQNSQKKLKTWIIINVICIVLWIVSVVMCFVGDVYFLVITMFVLAIILQMTIKIKSSIKYSEKGTIHVLHKSERYTYTDQENSIKKLTKEDLLKIAEGYKNKD